MSFTNILGTCTAPGCKAKSKTSGVCALHYQQVLKPRCEKRRGPVPLDGDTVREIRKLNSQFVKRRDICTRLGVSYHLVGKVINREHPYGATVSLVAS